VQKVLHLLPLSASAHVSIPFSPLLDLVAILCDNAAAGRLLSRVEWAKRELI